MESKFVTVIPVVLSLESIPCKARRCSEVLCSSMPLLQGDFPEKRASRKFAYYFLCCNVACYLDTRHPSSHIHVPESTTFANDG